MLNPPPLITRIACGEKCAQADRIKKVRMLKTMVDLHRVMKTNIKQTMPVENSHNHHVQHSYHVTHKNNSHTQSTKMMKERKKVDKYS